jgi:hypothetical protein
MEATVMTRRDAFVCPKCRSDETYLSIIDGKPYVICYLCDLRWQYSPEERRSVLLAVHHEPEQGEVE